MSAAAIFREHAKSAMKMAERALSAEDRKCLLAIARTWLRNAEKLERQDRWAQRSAPPQPAPQSPDGAQMMRPSG